MTTNSQWKALLEEFMAQENPARKVQMRAYMRNQFDFLGIRHLYANKYKDLILLQ